ncbi:hypothetical protein R6Z07F_005163 [Ovis aries]
MLREHLIPTLCLRSSVAGLLLDGTRRRRATKQPLCFLNGLPLYRLIEKVYKCSQSSQTPSRKVVLAATERSRTEVGSTLYTKANLILCRRDYLRLFGVTGNCAACSKLIPAFEMVMRAKDNVYHLDCFACQLCNQRFCVGDKFFLKNNMILCQTDYEEGLMKEGYAPQVR